MATRKKELLRIDGQEVTISNPDKLYFREAGITKLELVRYYLAVAEGALRGVRDRPMALKRFVEGAEGEFFFQKRAPAARPPWVDVIELKFPSGRSAHEIVVRTSAQLAWVVNLGCIDLNPLAREVERRAPRLATSKWWKEERHGVFVDYNQNAKDRTVASAYSVRPTPDARVSAPIRWEELPACDPAELTLRTMPARFARFGDVGAGIDAAAGSLEALLELSARQRAAGLGDAPWPPHYAKGDDEPPRVQPSRRKAAPRRTKLPVITVARAARREDALAGLSRWRAHHPRAAARLAPEDVLVDAMRGRFTTWTRVRVNLQHVPEAERPAEEAPDPDFDQARWDPRQ